MMPNIFHAGYADIEWTPELGMQLFGQMHERRGNYVRDPLMANAAAFQSGEESAVLVSVDVCVLDAAFVAAAQARFAAKTGLPGERLLLHATHTHVAPATISLINCVVDVAFMEHLLTSVVSAAEQALTRMEPVTLFAGTGHMEQMGWNRRGMFEDGSSRMYGHAANPGFIGSEGPRDPALPVLFTRNAGGAITGIVVNFATHPCAIANDWSYSADIPGEVRRVLKGMFGDIRVVYLTGAAGNIGTSIIDPHTSPQPWEGEEGIARSGLYLAGEAAKVIAATIHPIESPVLRLERSIIPVPLRNWPNVGDPTYPRPLFTNEWPEAQPYYQRAELEWPLHIASESPVPVRLNVLRLGDVAICTNPAELFVEAGLEIRRRSPARVTMISELTDGYVGYVQSPLALERGGYETWPAPTSKLGPEAFHNIQEETCDLLNKAFSD